MVRCGTKCTRWRDLELRWRGRKLKLLSGSDMEQEEEWEQQTGWGKAARRRKQVLGDDQEDASVEASREQAGMLGEARAQKDKAATESYEKRQMLWKGMAGRS